MWLRGRESNPQCMSQSHMYCHYTTTQYMYTHHSFTEMRVFVHWLIISDIRDNRFDNLPSYLSRNEDNSDKYAFRSLSNNRIRDKRSPSFTLSVVTVL